MIDISAVLDSSLALQKGKFDVVAIVRFITATLRYTDGNIISYVNYIVTGYSIIGSLSIVCSAVYRKTVCNPKV